MISLIQALPQIIAGIVSAFGSLMYKIVEIGGNIVKGLWSGMVALMIQPQSRGMIISDLDEYIEIDSELMSCFKGTALKNNTVKGAEFSVLKQGVCIINCADNVTRIEVIPRWCCL